MKPGPSEKRTLQVIVDLDLHWAVKRLAVDRRTSASAIIVEALRACPTVTDYLEEIERGRAWREEGGGGSGSGSGRRRKDAAGTKAP